MRDHVKWRRFSLATVGVAALAASVVMGTASAVPIPSQRRAALAAEAPIQAPARQPLKAKERRSFDVASIKPNKTGSGRHSLSLDMPGGRVRAINVSLAGFMTAAYQVPASRILGAPAWFDSEEFDIEATSEGNPTEDQNRLRLQSLLTDRFKLAMHHETRQLPLYALVLAKPGKLGPQLHLDDEKCGPSPAAPLSASPAAGSSSSTPSSINCGDTSGSMTSGRVRVLGRAVTVSELVMTLAGSPSNPNVDRPIVDRTGLTAAIDFTLEFAPLQLTFLSSQPGTDASALPSIFTALQEQLGLKLEAQTGPVDVLVIDHVEEPSPN
jgi:uncharacterized protein (TIGR03435 family)